MVQDNAEQVPLFHRSSFTHTVPADKAKTAEGLKADKKTSNELKTESGFIHNAHNLFEKRIVGFT